jgi:hypothetical protein
MDGFKKLSRTNVFKIIFIIILGAIGSGVWVHLLGPAYDRSQDFILSMISLGFKSYKDNTYQMIALGLHERPSILMLGHLTNWYFIASLIFVLFLFYKNKELRNKLEEIRRRREGCKKGEILVTEVTCSEVTCENLDREIEQLDTKLRRLPVLTYLMLFLIIVNALVMYTDLIRLSYVNSSISHFKQSLNICKPLIDETKEEELVALFSQVRNREDYKRIMEQLEELAAKNNRKLNQFNIW